MYATSRYKDYFLTHFRQTLNDHDTRTKLDGWLRSANVAVSQRDAANKRHSDTGKWLLERSEFQDWIYSQKSLLWLQGISGSGKTVLSSTIIETLRVRAESLVFFYFDTNNLEQVTVTQLLCSLVTQLSVQAPAPDRTLNALWRSYANGQHLPPNSGCVDQDIEAYITEILSKLDVEWPEERRAQIKKGLLERGGGMFRLVALQLDELRTCDGRESQVTRVLAELPMSLEAIYDRILENIKNVDMLSCVYRAMNWLLFSKRPLNLNEIIDSLAFDFGEEPLRFSSAERMRPHALLDACAGLVAISKTWGPTSIQVAHASVKEYFLSSKRPRELHSDFQSDSAPYITLSRLWTAEEPSFGPRPILPPLYLLAQIGIGQVVWELLKQGADVNTKGGRCGNALQAAAKEGHTNIVHHLLDHGADVNTQGGRFGNALSAASWGGHNETVQLLLEQGADVNMQGGNYGNALQAACFGGYTTIVQLLFEQGADVNAQGGLYGNALTAASSRGHSNTVCLLLEQGADVNAQGDYFGNALNAASWWGHNETVQLLLKHGVDVNAQGGYYGNALQAASSEESKEIVQLLLEHGADVNAHGGKHGNALQAAAAAQSGSEEIVQLLLEQGADVNMQGGEDGNALQAACSRGYTAIVQLLLEQGADVNAQGGEDGNALSAACVRGHNETVHLLLEQGADVNAQGGPFGYALQGASVYGHNETVHLLLEQGADVNAQGGVYGNALQAAAQRRSKEIMQLLLDQGADVNAQGGKHGNALQAARNAEIETLLLAHGAVPTKMTESTAPVHD
ncbi:ankyrin repeat-containing domain protein [Mycena rosella]|uniref:Ankyrin repeat-containing domain protein n=1 Tax=Mycena rosella TaxID=1033263 RepID=A0AAD7DEG8_MYCRO|nr:ankyrin repeat-containing domain protein [Mycena rosella]